MNCQLCQEKTDAYREDRLPTDTRIQVEAHLRVCGKCAESYRLQAIAERIINQEKEIQFNPFLSTRILTRIEVLETPNYKIRPLYKKVFRPVLLTAAVAAAIFYGIIIGSINKPVQSRESIPVELALIDDATIELVSILTVE
jgi:hypothetical protein